MKKRIKLVTVATTLLMLLLAACGGNTTSPTQTTTENADTNSSNSAERELSQTYTSDDGEWTFQYPAGWVVTTPVTNIILLATSEATANKTFTTASFEAGEAAIQLGLNTINDSNREPTTHVTNFASGINIPLGEASEVTVSERPGARVDGSNAGRHLMVVSQVFGEQYVDAVTYTNPGEFAQIEPTLLAIIESINFSRE